MGDPRAGIAATEVDDSLAKHRGINEAVEQDCAPDVRTRGHESASATLWTIATFDRVSSWTL
jgi:hypothetical protein